MKRITFSCLAAVILLQLIPANGNARDIRNQKEKNNRTEIKQDTYLCRTLRPSAREKTFPGQHLPARKKKEKKVNAT